MALQRIPLNKDTITKIWGKDPVFNSDGSMYCEPLYTNGEYDTSAFLYAIKSTLLKPATEFRLRIPMTLIKQFRPTYTLPTWKGAANEWETQGLMFNTKLRPNGVKVYCNLALFKTNGVEGGIAFDDRGQDFIYDAPTPKAVIGKRFDYYLEKTSTMLGLRKHVKYSIDGGKLLSMGKGYYNKPGLIGPYGEDCGVKVHEIWLEILK